MALEMKTTTFKTNNYTVSIKYVEFDPNLYDLKLLSQPGGSPQSVRAFYNSISNAEAAINGSLFKDSTNQYLETYGCLDSNGNLRGKFSGDTPCITMFGNSLNSKWVYNDNEARALGSKFVLNTAYYTFLYDSKICTDYRDDREDKEDINSPDYYKEGKEMYDTLHERAMIGQKKDGTIILAVTYVGMMTGKEQGQFLQSMGCTIGLNLDGGYSRNLVCGNQTAISSSRNVLNALVVVKKTSDPTPPVTPTNNEIRLIAKNTPFRVRASVVSGTELAMVPVGSSAKILQFLSGFQSDGYQWAKVEYNGITGYSQLDTSSDYLIEKQSASRKIYLKAVKLQFRVRSAPVNGSQLALVPVNGTAEILSTESNFASDGYQWAYVNYNGTKGYAQLDLQNAYNIIE